MATKISEVKIVCDLLNQIDNQDNRLSPLYNKSIEIAKYIEKYFGKVAWARNTENDFSNLGDLRIKVGTKEYDIELKMIESNNQGKGTLANSSQNIFSELDLINGATAWNKWRENNGYESKILACLNKNAINDKEIEEICQKEVLMDRYSILEKKARVIRKRVYTIADRYKLGKGAMASLIIKIQDKYLEGLSAQEKIAVSTIDEILTLARKDLQEYLDDCKNKGLNIRNIQKMMSLLKCGYHTIPLLKEKMKESLDSIKSKIKSYHIIYYYPNQKIAEERFKVEDPQKIIEWIERYKEVEAEIEGESLWVSSKGKNILQFKFHWRNVFFGIATPSVEIFDKTQLN